MAQLAQATDYTDKDFDSLRLRLQNLVRSVFPEWTDFNVASFGNILIELFAFVGDLLAFYQDNQARESRIATATQRKNLIALTKLLGFRPAGARAATADALFTLGAVPTAPVTLRAGTRVRTASVTDPIVCQLLEDVTIPASASPPLAMGTLEHSELQEELFASSGLPNQEVVLPATPFLDGSAAVAAGNGAYTEVQSFLGSGAADRHFIVVVDQNDRATVRFGNGVNGVFPSSRSSTRSHDGTPARSSSPTASRATTRTPRTSSARLRACPPSSSHRARSPTRCSARKTSRRSPAPTSPRLCWTTPLVAWRSSRRWRASRGCSGDHASRSTRPARRSASGFEGTSDEQAAPQEEARRRVQGARLRTAWRTASRFGRRRP
ncbi:MAG TPA: hypothetical protein VHC69_27880 [Polyangiaceae bacterium]|nr:hypothetical protein [Polyangiaceae bacterium]